MRRKRIVQAGKCYHLVSRVAHKAFFFDDEEKDRFVDLLMRVEFFSCVKVLAYCCMSNHIRVFIFLEFGMFGSGKGKKAEREKEMQKAPSELAEKYPMPPKYELALEEGNGETAKRLLARRRKGCWRCSRRVRGAGASWRRSWGSRVSPGFRRRT